MMAANGWVGDEDGARLVLEMREPAGRRDEDEEVVELIVADRHGRVMVVQLDRGLRRL
jgi:hypothetical protein